MEPSAVSIVALVNGKAVQLEQDLVNEGHSQMLPKRYKHEFKKV